MGLFRGVSFHISKTPYKKSSLFDLQHSIQGWGCCFTLFWGICEVVFKVFYFKHVIFKNCPKEKHLPMASLKLPGADFPYKNKLCFAVSQKGLSLRASQYFLLLSLLF